MSDEDKPNDENEENEGTVDSSPEESTESVSSDSDVMDAMAEAMANEAVADAEKGEDSGDSDTVSSDDDVMAAMAEAMEKEAKADASKSGELLGTDDNSSAQMGTSESIDLDLDDAFSQHDEATSSNPTNSSNSFAEIANNDINLDTLLKVPVSLSIEVGRTRKPINELLETREGSIIELDRLLDEPLDILVNGALIAHGIVVLANERFGIQITDIVSPEERARSI